MDEPEVQENPEAQEDPEKLSLRQWLRKKVDDKCVTVFCHVKRPYALHIITMSEENSNGDEKAYVGVGFSKVSYPDRWDAGEGLRMSRERAITHVAKQIFHQSPGPHPLNILQTLRHAVEVLGSVVNQTKEEN